MINGRHQMEDRHVILPTLVVHLNSDDHKASWRIDKETMRMRMLAFCASIAKSHLAIGIVYGGEGRKDWAAFAWDHLFLHFQIHINQL
jgi:hypothetical protein